MTYDQQNVQESEIVSDFLNAAGHGTAKANVSLAWVYSSWGGRYHPGIGKDDAKAFFWFRKAAAQGDITAQSIIGWMYGTGRGIEQNDELAVTWYRKAAEQGDATAQFNLGLMYDTGRGVEQNDELAVAWYRKAAEQGYSTAQYKLGWRYDTGRGVEQNDELAVTWYRKAAEQGKAAAQDILGWMYETGRGVEQSDEVAVTWYRKAAEQGNSDAQNHIGVMFATGRGIEQSEEQAEVWYRKAAEQGHATAQSNLGYMYQYGRVVEQNDELAVAWYRKGADQGCATAQFNLGTMYDTGRGVEQNDELAVTWYRKAADQGHLGAIEYLDLINQRSRQGNENKTKSRLETASPKVAVHPETLIHTTSRGDRVRSKSEVIIANLLHQAGIDYCYEADLSLLGFPKGVLPDFAFVQDQKVVVWEHLGMADDPEYMNRWAKKLAWYRQNGFESGKTLFVTTEMAGLGLDVASLERVVGQLKHVLNLRSVAGKQFSSGTGGLDSLATKKGLDESLVFLDFETSGLKPEDGSRAIEVGAVKLIEGRVTETFASLINPGVWLSNEIIEITKITNDMLRSAPTPSVVMRQLYKFLDGLPIVAHNANFDERFLRSEFAREGLAVPCIVICSMKVARRVVPGLKSYSLSALSDYYNLQSNKNAHRALPDAKQTVALWQALEKSILERSGIPRITVQLMSKLQEVPTKDVSSFLRNWRDV